MPPKPSWGPWGSWSRAAARGGRAGLGGAPARPSLRRGAAGLDHHRLGRPARRQPRIRVFSRIEWGRREAKQQRAVLSSDSPPGQQHRPTDAAVAATSQSSTMATLKAIAGKKYKLDTSENFDDFMKALGTLVSCKNGLTVVKMKEKCVCRQGFGNWKPTCGTTPNRTTGSGRDSGAPAPKIGRATRRVRRR